MLTTTNLVKITAYRRLSRFEFYSRVAWFREAADRLLLHKLVTFSPNRIFYKSNLEQSNSLLQDKDLRNPYFRDVFLLDPGDNGAEQIKAMQALLGLDKEESQTDSDLFGLVYCFRELTRLSDLTTLGLDGDKFVCRRHYRDMYDNAINAVPVFVPFGGDVVISKGLATELWGIEIIPSQEGPEDV